MASRIVIDGNAFYEIDEDCMRRKKKREEQAIRQTERQAGWIRNSGYEERQPGTDAG